ncbi:MAG: VWA domain-containing protein [Myxococcales bacterium]|nr:VWA domain-containing protein [Myxococcales bacterium]
MTFAGPIDLVLLAEAAAVAGGLVVVAYILKLRRRRQEVPFSRLWQRVLADKQSSSLFHRLRRLLSLLVQLVFLALLFAAALDPRLGLADDAGRTVVVIVDASASMKARDGGATGPTRLDRAKLRAREVLTGLGGADVAMVLRMDGQPAPLTRFEPDPARLARMVDGIEATDTAADLGRALGAAADALRGRRRPLIVIVGDGAYPEAAQHEVDWLAATPAAGRVQLAGIDVTFAPVGEATRNVGLVAFNVRRYFQNKLSYEALVELQNFGDEPETVRFSLHAGAEAIAVETITLPPGERVRRVFPDLGGGRDRTMRARITAQPRTTASGRALPEGDALALDDEALALLPERRRQRVLLVTDDNLYLEGALLLDDNLAVDKLAPAAYDAEAAAGRVAGYDVIVFHGHTPATPPAAATIHFAPDGPGSPVALRGELARPFITDLAPDHAVTRWVTLADVNIDRARVLIPRAGDTVLAASIRDPLIIAGVRDGRRFVAFGFALGGTDLPLRVAFPVLLMNALDWFSGDDAALVSTLRTGRTVELPLDAASDASEAREARVFDPKKQQTRAPVDHGRVRLHPKHQGLYQVGLDGDEVFVAANLADPTESNIRPASELVLGGRKLAAPPIFERTVTRALWVWLVVAAIALSAIEWLTYNRRVTV